MNVLAGSVETLTFNIPDWAKDKPIYVIAGKELLAYSDTRIEHVEDEDGNTIHIICREPIKQKVSRCNGCGQCCNDCVFLRSSGCLFGDYIPVRCLISD